MIPKELDDLIKEYLTDGIISPQERKVLLRKAESMGLDPEEIDLYITAQEQKVEKKEVAAAEQKFGKRCPQCGRQVESMTVRCECGYEFRSEKAVSSVQKLYDDLTNIQLTKAEMDTCKASDGTYYESSVDKIKEEKKLNMISTFPIPNTKEDIIEFLAMAAPNSKLKGGKFWGTKAKRAMVVGVIVIVAVFISLLIALMLGGGDAFQVPTSVAVIGGCAIVLCFTEDDILKYNKLAHVWRSKFDQTLMKGRSMRGDAEFQRQLDYYESIIKN